MRFYCERESEVPCGAQSLETRTPEISRCTCDGSDLNNCLFFALLFLFTWIPGTVREEEIKVSPKP